MKEFLIVWCIGYVITATLFIVLLLRVENKDPQEVMMNVLISAFSNIVIWPFMLIIFIASRLAKVIEKREDES